APGAAARAPSAGCPDRGPARPRSSRGGRAAPRSRARRRPPPVAPIGRASCLAPWPGLFGHARILLVCSHTMTTRAGYVHRGGPEEGGGKTLEPRLQTSGFRLQAHARGPRVGGRATSILRQLRSQRVARIAEEA